MARPVLSSAFRMSTKQQKTSFYNKPLNTRPSKTYLSPGPHLRGSIVTLIRL
jgi:hypothetical protein